MQYLNEVWQCEKASVSHSKISTTKRREPEMDAKTQGWGGRWWGGGRSGGCVWGWHAGSKCVWWLKDREFCGSGFLTHQTLNVSLRHYSYAIMDHHPLQLFLPVCQCVHVRFCVCVRGVEPLVYLSLKFRETLYMLYNLYAQIEEHSLKKELWYQITASVQDWNQI